MLSDPDHHVRINALDGLAALGVPGDATALAALLGDPHYAVWGRARTLLYTCGEDPRRNCSASGEVLAAALSLLDGDDPADEHTRHDLRRFLRSLDDPHEPARYEAVLGLQRWADATGTLPPDETDNARRRLTALTEDVSPRLRQAATRLLGTPDTGPP
ncbi:HEAT repeat domain-containing protein [Streptomyces variegatus]|uniref:HEAT repeat domain-containing protein n=1 Tax=Streptomyces variegatus TaxID=284040 RepID=UPI003C2EB621